MPDAAGIIGGVALVVAAIVSGIVAWRTNYATRKAEAQTAKVEQAARREERQAAERRDAIAERDAFIEKLAARLAHVESRLDLTEASLTAKAQVIRAQGDHIDALEAHIWQQHEPPPPPRPTGL